MCHNFSNCFKFVNNISLVCDLLPLYRVVISLVGTHHVKEHVFFDNVNWESLLRQKAEFIPQLDDEEDTSYFDCKFGVSPLKSNSIS